MPLIRVPIGAALPPLPSLAEPYRLSDSLAQISLEGITCSTSTNIDPHMRLLHLEGTFWLCFSSVHEITGRMSRVGCVYYWVSRSQAVTCGNCADRFSQSLVPSG